jgi:hypothetical protein
VFTPDGRELIFTRSDGYTRERIARLALDANGPVRSGTPTRGQRTEVSTDAAGGPSLSADGRLLAFHEQDVWRTNYYYNDIYLYDRVTHKKRRLTDGARAWNPGLSPDGKWVAFEMTANSSRGIGLMSTDSDRGAIEVLIPVANMEHAYTPVFSPDGKSIVFSWWRTGGFRDIYTLDVQTRALTQITNDRAYDLEPRYSPDGKWIFFVSDRTGVYNLFAHELATGKLYQVTNVINGVFDPAISPDGRTVAFVGFHADGYDLEVAALDPASWREAEPPLVDRPDSLAPPPGPPQPSHRYSPFPTLIPFTYSPYAVPDGYGEIIGVKLNGSDVVGRHTWSLQLGFGTSRADDVQFAFNYAYHGLWPELSAGVSHALTRRGGFIVNGRDIGWDADTWSFGAAINLPIYRRIVAYSDLSLSFDWSYTRNLSARPLIDPSEPIPHFPLAGGIGGFAASWSYSNQRRYQYSISTEEGRYLSLSLGLGSRALGSQFEIYSATWQWAEYVPIPWPHRFFRNHVLALFYSGGIAGGSAAGASYFFLGGYPSQNLLQSIYDFSRPGSASLRGYPFDSVTGDQFHVLNAEYRFPIVWIDRSYQTLPLYFRRLHGRVFADYGGAFTGGFSFEKLLLGVGGEAILEINYAYYYAASLQLGYAHGFMKGGGDQVYFLLNSPF